MTVNVADCRYGKMIYRVNDRYIGKSLDTYREFSEGEVALFRLLLNKQSVAIDVGANIGAHTLAMARLAKIVLAFEPLRCNFQMLCANAALNDMRNIHAYQMALDDGQYPMLPCPILDLDAEENNYGSTQLDAPPREGSAYEPVPCARLDDIIKKADFIKIDVEGMEEKVIRGSVDLIQRSRPILYVEDDQHTKHKGLVTLLLDLDYVPIWHMPLLYNAQNFAAQGKDIFPGLASFNLLCVPKEMRERMPVEGKVITRDTVDDFPQQAMVRDEPIKKTSVA